MVVYATSSEFSWRGDTEPLDEGQEVYERQELIHLPTADSMMVVIRIHESALGKVQIGQTAEITIDALAGKSFSGKVTRIAPLPDATSVFMNPDLKVYDTQIMIDGVHTQIRTGMSCKATIKVDQYIDALSVPIQAVVGSPGNSMVYVKEGKGTAPRRVVTGLDNNSMVHIIEGLNPGDRVLLTPPLEQTEKTANARMQADDSAQPGRPSGRPSGQPSQARAGTP
jgi:HlyD family secretion protein